MGLDKLDERRAPGRARPGFATVAERPLNQRRQVPTHVWLASLGGRVGLLAVGGTSHPPAYDTIDRTSDLVIGALRNEATFADTAMVPASTGTTRHVAAPPAVATARHRRQT